ncbi:hypothetical protein [Microtetraspora glauca]|uniref:Uncharacterized protein n=1 Tax=Microtetraspora glauca TaxID=1996 RepID=A0ABV3GTX0_MICGL
MLPTIAWINKPAEEQARQTEEAAAQRLLPQCLHLVCSARLVGHDTFLSGAVALHSGPDGQK